MKNVVKSTVLVLALAAGLSVAQAQTVDTSVDGIFTALTSSGDLQATVDTLIASGANPQAILSVAGAAGVPLDSVKALQVCVNSAADATVLSASCLRQRSMVVAYTAGLNDPMKYLPATAAGKRAEPSKK
ncbi:MAG: hypothetical protein HYZ65_00295 [Burkholderiales bacterium]|nr:hypothetical protein [Burkholderiales bacterium]